MMLKGTRRIAAKNGTGERVLWALNRRAPDLLHLLTADGRYIETVPRKGQAQWFDSSEASRAAYGDAQAMIQRDAARLRDRALAAGHALFLPLEEKWYRRDDVEIGVRQFIVQDPDGYLLRLSEGIGTRSAR